MNPLPVPICTMLLIKVYRTSLHEALDVEIQRIDGLNFAKASFGLQPIYDFPLADLTTVPALQLHGVWFRANPVSKEALNSPNERAELLATENAQLVAQMEQMKEEMERLQVELASVRTRRDLEQRVLHEERKEVAGLRLELESLKRRQSGTTPRLFRTPSSANASDPNQPASTPTTPVNAPISKSTPQTPSTQHQYPTAPSTPSIRLSNGVSYGTPNKAASLRAGNQETSAASPQGPQSSLYSHPYNVRHRESLRLAGYVLPAEEDTRMPWEKSN